jgi:2'-5' RNA ligase
VVWLGLSETTGGLQDLVTRVNEGLVPFGFEREDQGFQPHLTLGRVKSLNRKGPLIRKIQEFRNHRIGSMTVDRIFLMKSDLNPGGAVHLPLGEIPFPP